MDIFFDSWNKMKKEINKNSKHKFVKEGGVYWCNIGLNVGTETNGKNDNFTRPVLILKRFNHKRCLVIPLTTSSRDNFYKIRLGLIKGRKNFMQLSQIKAIDTKRILDPIKIIPRKKFIKATKTAAKLIEQSS